jgi:elongation factor G
MKLNIGKQIKYKQGDNIMVFLADHIRNVVVLGHQGAGKTTMIESLRAITENKPGTSTAMKSDQNALSSKSLSIVPVFFNDYKINLIDIPGNDDFIYEALGVTRLIKGAILVIDASKGVEVETIKHYNILRKRNIPTFIYLNKMDKDDADYDSTVEDIRSKIGKKALVFTYPIGRKAKFDGFINVVDVKARKFNGVDCEDDVIYDDKKEITLELHNAINEQVALSNDALLEKFFGGGHLSHDEIHGALRQGVLNGEFLPIIVGSAEKKIGLHTMLSMFVDYLPSPDNLKPYEGFDANGKVISRKTNDDEPFSAYVFKTIYNVYTGIMSLIKVNSGTIGIGDEVYCPNNQSVNKVTSLLFLNGKDTINTDRVHAGDIVAVPKLDNVFTGCTICNKDASILYEPAKYPTAVYFRAIDTKNKKDDDKLYGVLEKIKLEDPCIETKRNNETKQLLMGGTSETHLQFTFDKIKTVYGIELTVSAPKIVYRETIRKTAEAEGRYIKQSGGSGFYGVVVMRFEKNQENDNNVFKEDVFGGAVPKNYFPAVEKGFEESVKAGLLAGFPVIGVIATLLDGKYHPVDSNEQAFKMASIKAYKEAYMHCDPTILEPIILMKINVPQEFVGGVMSNLTKKRARIVDMQEKDGVSEISALAPEAEIMDYVSELRTLTQGSGFFNITFDSYKEVPANLIDDILKNNSLLNKDE